MMRERGAPVVTPGLEEAGGWMLSLVARMRRTPDVSRETRARQGLPSMVHVRLWWMTARTTPSQRGESEDTAGVRHTPYRMPPSRSGGGGDLVVSPMILGSHRRLPSQTRLTRLAYGWCGDDGSLRPGWRRKP
jgi:hypothetical protein